MTGALCCFCSLYTSTTVEYKHRVIYSVHWCCIVCTERPYYKREKCLKLLMKNSYSSSSSIVVKIIKFTVILMGKFFKPVNINICCSSSDLTYSITLLGFFLGFRFRTLYFVWPMFNSTVLTIHNVWRNSALQNSRYKFYLFVVIKNQRLCGDPGKLWNQWTNPETLWNTALRLTLLKLHSVNKTIISLPE